MVVNDAALGDGMERVEIAVDQSWGYCWWNLFDQGDQATGINNVPFAVSNEPREDTTLGLNSDPTSAMSAAALSSETSSGSQTTSPGRTTITIYATGKDPTSDDDNDDDNDDEGLTTPAKVGIGLDVTLALLTIAVVTGAFLTLRRPRAKEAEAARVTAGENKHYLYAKTLPPRPARELPAGQSPWDSGLHELPADNWRDMSDERRD